MFFRPASNLLVPFMQPQFRRGQDAAVAGGTFGITSNAGLSTATLAVNEGEATRFAATASSTVSKLTAWLQGSGGTRNVKGMLYADDGTGDTPGTRIAISNAASLTTTAQWLDLTFSSPPSITDTTVYWLAVVADGSFIIHYKASAGSALEHQASNNYTTPSNPWVAGSGLADLVMAIYATYP